MTKVLVYIILFSLLPINSYSNEPVNDFLLIMNKYTSTNSLTITGTTSSFILKTDKPVMSSDFKMAKANGNVFYEDKYHTLIIKPVYDIWIDHANKFIFISYKIQQKQKVNKIINPANVFEFIKSQIKVCTSKDINDGKEYNIQYNLTKTDCVKSIVEIDKNEDLKRIEYYFSDESYLNKTIIRYKTISIDNFDEIQLFNENKYITKVGNKWTATNSFKNYKIQIFEYEQLF